MTTRLSILKTAGQLTKGKRNQTYGHPVDNMQHTANLWTALLGEQLTDAITAEQVAHMMTLLKISRTTSGNYHPDNYIDGAAYTAIAGECAHAAQ